jgi:hypothetical protein
MAAVLAPLWAGRKPAHSEITLSLKNLPISGVAMSYTVTSIPFFIGGFCILLN